MNTIIGNVFLYYVLCGGDKLSKKNLSWDIMCVVGMLPNCVFESVILS